MIDTFYTYGKHSLTDAINKIIAIKIENIFKKALKCILWQTASLMINIISCIFSCAYYVINSEDYKNYIVIFCETVKLYLD